MARISEFAITAAALGIALPYVLDGRWAAVTLSVVAWTIWLLRARYRHIQGSTIGFLLLIGLGSAGVYLEYNSLWLLTYFVLLLIAWDLSRFAQVLEQYGGETSGSNEVGVLITPHLKRLGLIAGVGWVLGAVALILQITTTFLIALFLGILVFLGLLLVLRYFGRESG